MLKKKKIIELLTHNVNKYKDDSNNANRKVLFGRIETMLATLGAIDYMIPIGEHSIEQPRSFFGIQFQVKETPHETLLRLAEKYLKENNIEF